MPLLYYGAYSYWQLYFITRSWSLICVMRLILSRLVSGLLLIFLPWAEALVFPVLLSVWGSISAGGQHLACEDQSGFSCWGSGSVGVWLECDELWLDAVANESSLLNSLAGYDPVMMLT
ncbi:hypothetical protein Nepgr_030080 [Nepenthes gracilis]|uniref:Uncharacterized protein n=1 Tax=Nepenthes gracilis TaxID=150966 RepID=A0AAD3TF47_NEPGR|nr:hypothetical protein Nepgr_030080 [Nepenthes gracilis]